MRHLTMTSSACLFVLCFGCSHAQYSATSLPSQFAAKPHISARHVDLTAMQHVSPPAEWLQPGDEVEVVLATGIENGPVPKWQLRVDSQGQLNVPLVGTTFVAGSTPAQAADRIRGASVERGLYVDPKVTVSVVQKRTFQVAVVGAVTKPDSYDIPATSCDLLTAITLAEGMSEDASRYIQIKHSPTTLQNLASTSTPMGPDGVRLASFQSGPPAATVNIDLARIESYPPEALQLYDGSVVSVVREPKRFVSVIGLVRDPKKIEMPPGESITLLEAIADAGGTTLSIADKVHVVRTVSDQSEPVVIEASLADARSGGEDNLTLNEGDIISVEETVSTATLTAIQTFFRVGFSAALPGL